MSIDYGRLERNLAREFRQYHVTAQIYRVAIAFAGALSLQLKDGWQDWTWKGLYALALAAGYATLKHFLPSVSWKLVLDHLHIAQLAAAQQDARDADTAAKAATTLAAEQAYKPVTAEAPQSPDKRPDPALPE